MNSRRLPRSPRRPLPALGIVAATALANGCGSITPADAVDRDPDASASLPVDASPGACAEPIQTRMLVGGESPLDGSAPLLTVILGDTIVLSAVGSCSSRGPLSYEWQLGEALAATADPGIDSESLTVYPTEGGDHPITLTVRDSVAADEPITVHVRVLPWIVVDSLDVRDVAVGAGRIWIASNVGPRFYDLLNPDAGVQDLNVVADGDEIPADLAAVFYDDDDDLVWFGRLGQDDGAYRLDLAPFEIASVPFPSPSIGQTTVRDITAQEDGVMFATQEGVTIAADNETFAEPVIVGDRTAVGDNQAGGWVGANNLVRLSDDEVFTPFGAGDNRILAIAGDEELLWVGGDDNGVARLNADLSVDVFRTGDGLPSNRVRGLAVDRDHDAWAATQTGAARYKVDRDAWVPMGGEAGLEGLTDLVSASTGVEGGRTVVAVGGPQGLAVLGP